MTNTFVNPEAIWTLNGRISFAFGSLDPNGIWILLTLTFLKITFKRTFFSKVSELNNIHTYWKVCKIFSKTTFVMGSSAYKVKICFIQFWWHLVKLLYTWVLQLHQVSSKSDEKQKSFVNSPFFCSEFQSVSRIVKIVYSALSWWMYKIELYVLLRTFPKFY